MGLRVSRNFRASRKLLRRPKNCEAAAPVTHLAGCAGRTVRDKQR